jgi:arylformamidase
MTRVLPNFFAIFLLLLNPALAAELPPGVKVQRDIAYGSDAAQRLDVYLPPQPSDAPILLMVHGGGWRRGDKDHSRVVDNKLAHFVPKGVIFVTINYRMMPEANPINQAADVARALAKVQQLAPSWGGDAATIILMGHSAGAHLVALISAAPDIAVTQGAKPWKGAVLLDSGALNVPQIMTARHLRLYDRAFGKDPAEWQAASPFHRLSAKTVPMLAVCSSKRSESCPMNRAFAAKANSLGGAVEVLPLDLSHGEINMQLGQPGAYTDRVEAFLRSLGWKV